MKVETKVGLLFVVAVAMVAAFAYYLGVLNPFSASNTVQLGYNFAGGIEVGSKVRVMGIEVGKITAIDFDPNLKMPNGEEVKLRVTATISKKAWPAVRKDSRFFINLAGVIGEKYLEVSPGTNASPAHRAGGDHSRRRSSSNRSIDLAELRFGGKNPRSRRKERRIDHRYAR